MLGIRTLLANMNPRGRAVLVAAVLGTLLVAFLLFRIAARPSYAPLLSGLDPADTGKVTAALDEQGIGYELRNNGTAIAVTKADAARARIAVAEQGMPDQGKPGFELFDKQKLGTSDFQQKVAYERALEGEIGRTIEQVDGVSGSTVELVLPEDELFADEQRAAKAAVLLAGDADALQPGAVRGMAQLVASSVKGLELSNVTINDGTGRLLWPSGTDSDGGTSGVGTKHATQARYEQELGSSLNAMLAQALGPGKALVRVNADLDADMATQDRLEYDKKRIPLRSEDENERLRGVGGAAGASGAAANIPSYGQAAGSGGDSRYNRRSRKTDYAIGKTVTRTKIAPGKVNQLQVALLVDESVPASQLDGLSSAVAAAAGLNTKRGDVLRMSSVPFAGKPAASEPQDSPITGLVPLAKWVALGLAVLAFLFFIARHLRRQEQATLGEPDWLRELTRPVPVGELDAATLTMPVPAPQPSAEETRLARIRQAAEREPDRVAQQVRAWMQES